MLGWWIVFAVNEQHVHTNDTTPITCNSQDVTRLDWVFSFIHICHNIINDNQVMQPAFTGSAWMATSGATRFLLTLKYYITFQEKQSVTVFDYSKLGSVWADESEHFDAMWLIVWYWADHYIYREMTPHLKETPNIPQLVFYLTLCGLWLFLCVFTTVCVLS